VSVRELKEYLSDRMRVPATHIVVRKPGEPTEEYQTQNADRPEVRIRQQTVTTSNMKDAPKVNAEDFHSTKANMSLLKELLKDREAHALNMEVGKDNKTQELQSNEEKGTPSPTQRQKVTHTQTQKGNKPWK
jgi:hypothetical protein